MTARLAPRGRGLALGIRPDLLTLGKWVGGGMSCGAFGGRRDVMGMFDPRTGRLQHAGTFNNNVVSMAAGVAGCGLLTDAAIEALNAMGVLLKRTLDSLLRRYGLGDPGAAEEEGSGMASETAEKAERTERYTMWTSGLGSILTVHFGGPARELRHELFFRHMLREGLYLAPRGFIALSMAVTAEQVWRFAAAVETFLVAHAGVVVREGEVVEV
jgi:glutamate-1-semialdehyde 2,1-aminomutase